MGKPACNVGKHFTVLQQHWERTIVVWLNCLFYIIVLNEILRTKFIFQLQPKNTTAAVIVGGHEPPGIIQSTNCLTISCFRGRNSLHCSVCLLDLRRWLTDLRWLYSYMMRVNFYSSVTWRLTKTRSTNLSGNRTELCASFYWCSLTHACYWGNLYHIK